MAPKKSKVKKPKVERSVTQPAKGIIERSICSHPMLKRVQKESPSATLSPLTTSMGIENHCISRGARKSSRAAKHSSRNYVAPISKQHIFGWHASYFGGFDAIMLKINSIAYFKDKPARKPNRQEILSGIYSCKDFINRSSDFGAADTSVKLDLPRIVKSNYNWFSEVTGGLQRSSGYSQVMLEGEKVAKTEN
ncbi:unnamed protein product [Bathycoccus prasinos]